MPFSRTQPPPCPTACPRPSSLPDFPTFPDYRWPAFLQGIMSCGNSARPTGYPAAGCGNRAGKHSQQTGKFCVRTKAQVSLLQVFVTAPPASGKGALTWVRRLAEPIHNALLDTYREKIKTYRMEKTKWDTLGKGKGKYPRTRTAPAENAPHSRRQYRYQAYRKT